MLNAQSVAPLRVGDVVEISCTDLIAKTGQAVGRADGMVVYVFGPVPGERARVRIETVKPRYAVAELVELLDRSPQRTTPFCPVFGTCGGCQVQHLRYAAQLVWKRGLVENALQRIGGIKGATVAETIGMDDARAYRNKMALVVDHENGRASFGFYAARTHDVVPIRGCPIVMPVLDRTIGQLWDVAGSGIGEVFDGARHVVARAASISGEGVASVTTERASPQLAHLGAELGAALPAITGVDNSYELPSENAVMGRRHATVYGSAEMEEEIAGIRFRVSPASFFQVNAKMVGKIFAFIGAHAPPVERLVDLYCGAGTFALYFATRGARVVGIEENPNAVREARANAALNRLGERATFIAGRVESVLRGAQGRAALAATQTVFLDPPRKGSDEPTLEAIVRARVPNVWYLSCNPATLARDLAQLTAGGYRLGLVQPFDMFPQTGHIEALVALTYENGHG